MLAVWRKEWRKFLNRPGVPHVPAIFLSGEDQACRPTRARARALERTRTLTLTATTRTPSLPSLALTPSLALARRRRAVTSAFTRLSSIEETGSCSLVVCVSYSQLRLNASSHTSETVFPVGTVISRQSHPSRRAQRDSVDQLFPNRL